MLLTNCLFLIFQIRHPDRDLNGGGILHLPGFLSGSLENAAARLGHKTGDRTDFYGDCNKWGLSAYHSPQAAVLNCCFSDPKVCESTKLCWDDNTSSEYLCLVTYHHICCVYVLNWIHRSWILRYSQPFILKCTEFMYRKWENKVTLDCYCVSILPCPLLPAFYLAVAGGREHMKILTKLPKKESQVWSISQILNNTVLTKSFADSEYPVQNKNPGLWKKINSG